MAYWVDYGEPNKSCYHVKDQDDGREYAVEFINDAWHVLDWTSGGWRTHASKYFSTKDQKHVGLGWYCYAQALGVVEVGSLLVELSGRLWVRSGRPSCRALQGQNHGVGRGYEGLDEVRQLA